MPRLLNISRASHSPLVDGILDDLETVVRSLALRSPRLPLISGLTGRLAGAEVTRPGYWSLQVRAPVRFGDGLATALGLGASALIEIGPQPVLLGLTTERSEPVLRVASVRPGMPDVILGGLAQLWSIGAPVDWRAAWAPTPRRKVALPPHPYDKQRYWLETSATAEGQPTGHPLLGARLDTAGRHTFEASLSLAEHPWLADHQVGGRVIVPATVWLEWLRAAAAAAGPAVPGASEALCDVAIERPLILEHGTGHRLQAVVDPAGRRVEIFSRTGDGWERHAAARFQPARALVPLVPDDDTRHEVAVGELYEALRAVGLAYGPGFAALERLQRGVDHALGEVAVSPSLLAEPAFPCHPAALDAALHTAAALLASEREIWLPVAFEDVIVLPSAAARWQVTARLRPGTRDERVVDVSVFEPSGRPVALFGGLALRRMASPSHRAMPHREAYAIEWAPAPADAAAAVRDRRWWLIGRGALADAVAAALPGPVLRSVERAPSDQPAGSIDAVVDLSACDEVGAGAAPALDDELGALLLRTQALLRRPPGARLWLVTRGAQLLEGDRTAPVTAAHQAARWGFGRTLAQEHPGLGCRLVDLDPDASIADAARAVLAELAVQDDLDQTAWRRAERYAAQLVRAGEPGMAMPVAPAFCLHLAQSGALDELRFAPIAQPEPGPGQVEIEVEAVGLNFRDVLNALGLTSLNGQAGGECAGRVLSVGPGVEGLAAGDPVVAFAPGALGSRVIADAVVVARRPARLGPVEVATAPVAFLTAWYGLFDLAGLRPGQRVLVHAAAGGVGMAAVQLARRAGAEVIATASAGKHDAVRALGVEHVFSSRDPGFADEIEARFGPRPVDVVLNALTGPFIPAGLRLLRPGGHFLEMGKLELWTPAQLADYPDAVYQPFELFEVAPARIAALLRELMAALDDGSLQPLPRTVFPFERASDAFRFMAQARHIGKIVLTPRPVCDPQGWYLVTGGLGGLGREVVRYLAARGARRLVVLQRRAVTDDAARFIAELAAAGIEIEPRTLDLTCPEALLRLFAERGGPPRGIVHAAAVLDDGVLGAQTPRRFAQVLAPKLHGAIALEAATRGAALDFFVMFSSIAGVVGSPGQAGYAAASAGLDGLAAAMRAQGRPSISVAYGTWAQIGLAAALGEREQRRLDAAGIRALAPALGMRYFERALVERRGHLVVADLDLPRLQRLHQPPPHWLSALLASAPVPGANAATAAADELTGIVARFAALPSDQRQAMLVDELRGVAARVLGLPRSALEPHRPLRDTGLDSLMAVEMQNALVRSLGVPLPRTLLLDHPTLDALATYLCTELSTRLGSEPRSEAPRAEPSRVDASTPELRALHDEIVELEKLV
jgi:NADPH:quinone reductase-like Zn-dependent oxidoreductase/acyl carrier protein